MEKYVVSRELAEKLKEAGFPQTPVYCWYKMQMQPKSRALTPIVIASERLLSGYEKKPNYIAAAPMTDELLEQLPDRINDKYVKLEIRHIGKHTFMPMLVEERLPEHIPREYHPNYNELAFDEKDSPLKDIKTRPNALAQLWLYCNENSYLEERM